MSLSGAKNLSIMAMLLSFHVSPATEMRKFVFEMDESLGILWPRESYDALHSNSHVVSSQEAARHKKCRWFRACLDI